MEGTLAEIRLFAGTFAPRYWAYCQGQLLAINTNTALFSLLGTTYGGNGTSTFGIPDLRGRVALGTGQPTYGGSVTLGQTGGLNSFSLLSSNMPVHNHNAVTPQGGLPVSGSISATMTVAGTGADSSTPKNNYIAEDQSFAGAYAATPTPGSTLNSAAISVSASTLGVSLPGIALSITGSSLPIDNTMPYMGMNYIICTAGIFPSRN